MSALHTHDSARSRGLRARLGQASHGFFPTVTPGGGGASELVCFACARALAPLLLIVPVAAAAAAAAAPDSQPSAAAVGAWRRSNEALFVGEAAPARPDTYPWSQTPPVVVVLVVVLLAVAGKERTRTEVEKEIVRSRD